MRAIRTVFSWFFEHFPSIDILVLAIIGWTPSVLSAQESPPAGDKGQEREAVQGLFLTVPAPIESKGVNRIKAATNRFLQDHDHRLTKIVYDFNPGGLASGNSDYGPCHDLAEFLLDLQDVTTVAFVHDDVTGHAVLPVLACKDLVMAAQSKIHPPEEQPRPCFLGDVMRDQTKPLKNDQRQFYEEVATGRGRCPAIVLKMIDKEMNVLEGTRRGAVWFIDSRREKEEAEQGFVVTGRDPVLPAGQPGLYSAELAIKFTLCNLIRDSRQEVAQAYRLSPRSFRGDPLEGRAPVAWRIVVKGTVDNALKETLDRHIRRAIAQGANLIILQLECGGGTTQAARDLADMISALKDDTGHNKVMTVAFVTDRARDTATFLALGCTEIVMSKQAALGGFERIIQERPQYRDAIQDSLQELAESQGYNPMLARGMVNPDLVIHRVRSKIGPLERTLLDAHDLDPEKWIDEGQIKGPGEWLVLNGPLTEELGIAQLVVEGSPSEALPVIYSHYGLDKEQVHTAGPDWLDDLAAFLGHPMVSLFLVMIGIAGLVLELKMPGVGLPGVVAAVCFVLYFWAHSHLAGHLTMLALLLFVLGLILIGLEVFVVPGFGVTGISGVLLVVVSLALATLVKKPETTQEWLEFGATLSKLGFSLVVAVIGAFVVAWYLPSIPYANRLVLAPLGENQNGFEGDDGGTGPESNLRLLGAIGEAATPLRPAGKARFGDEFVDVVAEGSYVHDGTRVQVVEVEGNRVVVKEV